MKKYTKNMILYILIWMAVVGCLDGLFWTNYHYSAVMMQEMYQYEKNIDVLFLGSCHAQLAYDSNRADKILGIETFNAGSSSQPFVTSYYLLKEIEKQNHVETVYLDTYYAVSDTEILEAEMKVYVISDYMKWSWNKIEYLWKACGGRGIVNGVLCSFRRNLGNTDIRKNIQSRKLTVENFPKELDNFVEYCGKGFVYSYEEIETEYPDIDFKEAAESFDLTNDIPMSNDSYEYLIKIIDYCKKNNINLVLVDQPMPDELLSEVKGYDNYVEFLSELAEEYEIDYMNFNLYKGYEKSLDDYYDTHHLNGPGAEKYTEIFCNTVNALKNHERTMEDIFYREYSPEQVKWNKN